jgi:hypothetical protein
LLGLLQGGFIPDLVLYLVSLATIAGIPADIYQVLLFQDRRIAPETVFVLDHSSTSVRSVGGIEINANPYSDIVAPLIAFGVLRMRGVAGREGWRWLFLIEGVFMLSVAIW